MEKSVKELAEESKLSRTAVYYVAKKLGRLPTLEELKTKSYVSKAGRKPKNFKY